MSQNISQALLPEFDQEMQSTRKLLECVPDEPLGWKPHPKSMALGRLAGHVAELPNWATMTLKVDCLDLTPDMKPTIAASRAQLLALFDQNAAEAREAIGGATDEAFAQAWTLKFQGNTVFSMPRVAVMRSVVMNHLIHHRAQLGVYLRLLDVAIPGMYGPSADEAPAFSAKTA